MPADCAAHVETDRGSKVAFSCSAYADQRISGDADHHNMKVSAGLSKSSATTSSCRTVSAPLVDSGVGEARPTDHHTSSTVCATSAFMTIPVEESSSRTDSASALEMTTNEDANDRFVAHKLTVMLEVFKRDVLTRASHWLWQAQTLYAEQQITDEDVWTIIRRDLPTTCSLSLSRHLVSLTEMQLSEAHVTYFLEMFTKILAVVHAAILSEIYGIDTIDSDVNGASAPSPSASEADIDSDMSTFIVATEDLIEQFSLTDLHVEVGDWINVEVLSEITIGSDVSGAASPSSSASTNDNIDSGDSIEAGSDADTFIAIVNAFLRDVACHRDTLIYQATAAVFQRGLQAGRMVIGEGIDKLRAVFAEPSTAELAAIVAAIHPELYAALFKQASDAIAEIETAFIHAGNAELDKRNIQTVRFVGGAEAAVRALALATDESLEAYAKSSTDGESWADEGAKGFGLLQSNASAADSGSATFFYKATSDIITIDKAPGGGRRAGRPYRMRPCQVAVE